MIEFNSIDLNFFLIVQVNINGKVKSSNKLLPGYGWQWIALFKRDGCKSIQVPLNMELACVSTLPGYG